MLSNPKHFGLKQYYYAVLRMIGAVPTYSRNLKKNTVSKQFIERIVLAVTQVNGCEACSYAHTKMAIE